MVDKLLIYTVYFFNSVARTESSRHWAELNQKRFRELALHLIFHCLILVDASFCCSIKGITPKMCMLCVVLVLFWTFYVFGSVATPDWSTTYSCSFGGWGGGGGLYFTGVDVLGSFSLWEPTCMHCVYMTLWAWEVLWGSFCEPYVTFIHSNEAKISVWVRSDVWLAELRVQVSMVTLLFLLRGERRARTTH